MKCVARGVETIWVGVPTAAPPPATFPDTCTVTAVCIIVSVFCAEVPVVVMSHEIKGPSRSVSSTDVQPVHVLGAFHSELLVGPGDLVATLILQVKSQLHTLSIGEAVDVLQPIPELSLQVSKAFLVIAPFPVEVLCPSRHSPLDD